MRKLQTQADGRRYAIDVLRQLGKGGTERCRANLPAPYISQADALIMALVEIKERATVDACIGFGQIVTDAVGTRSPEPMPELYEQMERAGGIRPYRLKRLVNRGSLLAVLALNRETESGNADRMPAKAEPVD